MNISLTPDLEKYVQSKVRGGLYTSASEVIRESLRIMLSFEDVQKKRIKELDDTIALAMKQIQHGQKIAGDQSYKKMKAKIKKIAEGK
ncbi:MAG: hypothetical protein A3E84_04350 [Gammaproteobacteria bacterium RIFCSPHIGHO2_12_FULL_42_13]|nr:MAG: hypothetical protein A3E84_04350 [Gammaproteobacteria bacterium RIFCSPHIGHO2_12_FULL_42_13]